LLKVSHGMHCSINCVYCNSQLVQWWDPSCCFLLILGIDAVIDSPLGPFPAVMFVLGFFCQDGLISWFRYGDSIVA
jgi:hypothetical protein